MLEHPDEKTILQFLEECLAQVESNQVASHLDRCSVCRKSAENLIDQVTLNDGGLDPNNRLAGVTLSVDAKALVKMDTSPDDSLPQIPQNRFLIIGELARGGMGIVYRGFDRALKRQVAIKVPRQNSRGSNAYRLCREADISSQLQHPGVVPIYERGQLADGRPYIVMKLIEGKTLLESIRVSDSNQLELLRVFGDIVRTMAYAHSLNYVHRDLKPQNVMIGKFGEVQIIDWGLAKRLDPEKEIPQSAPISDQQQFKQNRVSLTRAADQRMFAKNNLPSTCTASDGIAPGETQIGAVMGSHGYMSPEQSQGSGASKRSDVFAIGAILFQILTGDAPCESQTVPDESFSSNTGHEAIEFEHNRPMAKLDGLDCSREIIALCKACLSESPFQRPQDAQVVKALLGQNFYLKTTAGQASGNPLLTN